VSQTWSTRAESCTAVVLLYTLPHALCIQLSLLLWQLLSQCWLLVLRVAQVSAHAMLLSSAAQLRVQLWAHQDVPFLR
jgi:hypothetical protein